MFFGRVFHRTLCLNKRANINLKITTGTHPMYQKDQKNRELEMIGVYA